MTWFPRAALEDCSPDEANALLTYWGHKMGPCLRPPGYGFWAQRLTHEGQPVGVLVAASLVREHVGGGCSHLDRSNTVELARVCAARPDLCRVLVRMWRELVFPSLGKPYAISYQDSVEHRGDLYRFDGWVRLADVPASGTDQRTGRKGRPRVIWGWPRTIPLPQDKPARGAA